MLDPLDPLLAFIKYSSVFIAIENLLYFLSRL